MSQDHDHKPDAPHFKLISIEAAPPAFRHADIKKQYEKGEYQSRLQAEVVDILRDCQLLEAGEAGTIPLTAEALEHLNCLAIIQNGQIIHVVDMERMQQPETPAQRMDLCAIAARAILDALIEALQYWDKHPDQPHVKQDDDDEGGGCYAKLL